MGNGGVADRLKRITDLARNLDAKKQKQLLCLLNSWQHENQRGEFRIPCFLAVDFVYKGRGIRAFCKNLEPAGAFIEVRGSFNIGDDVCLVIYLSQWDMHLKTKGKIVRQDAHGIAVSFDKALNTAAPRLSETLPVEAPSDCGKPMP
jgi:hypothetical protein